MKKDERLFSWEGKGFTPLWTAPSEMLEYEETTEIIIGAAIEVQKRLGPGFLESIYENALCLELAKRDVQFERQTEIAVLYDGQPVGTHRLDLIVQDAIVVELKAITALEDVHIAIVRSYLKAAGKKHGLLLNFGKVPLEIRRVLAS